MPHFLFAYHGGKQPDTPEETEVEIERWRGWFDRIGPAIVDPGNPVGTAKTVSAKGVSDSGGDNPLSGYTITMPRGSTRPLNWRRPARSSVTAASRWRKYTKFRPRAGYCMQMLLE